MSRADPPIETVTACAYRIPTDQPEADGTIAWDSTTIVIAQVAAGGQSGLGFTYATTAAATLIRDVLAAVVQGRNAWDVPAANQAMARAVRNIGRPGIAATAISAIDVALWDLKARLLDVRLVKLLGVIDPAVPVYGSGGFTTYDEARLEAQLGGWVHTDGITRVKIKIGESWGTNVERDLRRVRQARQIIGPSAELYVDANGGYSRKQAIRVARGLSELDVTWFEEPVSSDDLVGLDEVRRSTDIDVAAGEYGYDLQYFQRMCPAVDCLQADVTRCGGITEWQRIAALAAAQGLAISGHCAPHLHLDAAAATPNLRHLEWFHDHVRIESMLFDGAADPVRGQLSVDMTAAGHGLQLKDRLPDHFRVI